MRRLSLDDSAVLDDDDVMLPPHAVELILRYAMTCEPVGPLGRQQRVALPGSGDVGFDRAREDAAMLQKETFRALTLSKDLHVSAREGRYRHQTPEPLLTQLLILKCLYHAPHLTHTIAFRRLCEAVLRGERRWDSLKRIPHSIPGRYITSLDLSALVPRLDRKAGPSDYLLVNNCLASVLPLMPNLVELKLPTEIGIGWSTLRVIQTSAVAQQLRVLEGVRLQQTLNNRGQDPVVALLQTMPNLEAVGVSGLGSMDDGFEWDQFPSAQDPLVLPKLHSLTLKGIKHGLFISNLINSTLPTLRRLAISSYATFPNDLTQDLIRAHGPKLTSLTFLPTNEWPAVSIAACPTVLKVCPNLLHLANLTLSCAPIPETFARNAVDAPHPLERLTISRWSNSTSQSTPAIRPDKVLQMLFSNLATVTPHLRTIQVENFSWLRRDLGKAAMETGINGTLRKWAATFATRGVMVVDKDGTTCPPLSPILSPRRGSAGASVTGPGRLGMSGVGERRRQSMDGDDDDEGG